MKFSLTGFALKRPVTVTMISVSMLIIGGIAWFRMPLQFLPRVDRPVITCSIPYPGGTPEQVEQQITIPVEGEFRTVPGMRFMRTTSDGNGCSVFMLFNLDVDMTRATAEVRDRIERLKLKLPSDVDRMLIQRFSSTSIPVIAFGLFSEGDLEDFTYRVRTLIEPRLRRLKGVAHVEVHSPVQPREVLIEFEQDKLRAMNLGLAEVIARLRESSLNLSIGQLRDGDLKYYVRVTGEYRRLEDLANTIIAPDGLRLREAAEIRYSSRAENVHVALDGMGGVVVLVIKESEANTVDTCDAVHAEMAQILDMPLFRGTALKIFFDQSDLITRALKNLLQQGLYGGAMAICVLFFFLHRLLPTVIVSLAIPTSLVVALVFMFFSGMSLNLVTMVSMIIAVGMLVDNAIVVVENIIRHRQMGHSPIESSMKGASEVGLAIFASTATTWVVFVPMYYLETGRMSVFMEQLGAPLIVALGGSLLIALTVIPLAMSRMKMRQQANVFLDIERSIGGKQGHTPGLLRWLLVMLGKIQLVPRIIRGYSRALRTILNWRLASMFALSGLIAITLYLPVREVGMRDLPKLDTRQVTIRIELEQNFDMDMARELFGDIEARIDMRRDKLGIKNILCFHQATGGSIEVYLYTEDDDPSWKNPPYDTEEVLLILREDIPRRLPGTTLSMSIADAGESGTGRGVSVRLRGDNTRILNEYAERFKLVMENISGLSDVETDTETLKQEMQIKIDEPVAKRTGISPMIIAQTVDAALRGARMPYMKQGGREIPVWAQFREEDRKSRSNLENVAVMSPIGGLTPLNQLVDFSKEMSPAAIRRVNGKNVTNITAKTDTDNLSRIRFDLTNAVRTFDLPPGYSIEFGDELEELGENMFSFATTLLMAIILIYLVMSALFESYLLPLSILTTVPLSLGGSIWMLYFTGTPLDTVTLIGNILMVGIIVNNGIVIVDYINSLRASGHERSDAIVRAGVDRFRPVMMTALTTILGLVPLALAKTGGAATFAGLGRALIGGLTMGTMLTLIVVPLFYVLLDDFQQWCVNYFGGFSQMQRKKPASAAKGRPS